MSSELPCISMNLISFARYSSGIQSPVSTWPPPCTYSRNSCSVTTPPSERSLGYAKYDHETRRADSASSATLRREGLPRHVDGRSRRGDGRAEGLALRAHRVEAGS